MPLEKYLFFASAQTTLHKKMSTKKNSFNKKILNNNKIKKFLSIQNQASMLLNTNVLNSAFHTHSMHLLKSNLGLKKTN